MSEKIDDDTFDDIEDDDNEISEDEIETEVKVNTLKTQFDARRRLEQMKEDRELERLLNGDYY